MPRRYVTRTLRHLYRGLYYTRYLILEKKEGYWLPIKDLVNLRGKLVPTYRL